MLPSLFDLTGIMARRKKTKNVSISHQCPELFERARVLAKKERRTFSGFMVNILEQYVKERGRRRGPLPNGQQHQNNKTSEAPNKTAQ